MHHDRHGAKQPGRFDPARFGYVAPEMLLAELALPPAATLVDFGAGTGLYAIALAQRRPDLRVVALDEQPAMREHLRAAILRAGVTNVEAADPAALAALHERADGVLALNVLHELGDSALAELRALLAPDRPALFVDWNAEVERPVGPPRDHVYGPEDAIRRLEAAGSHHRGRTRDRAAARRDARPPRSSRRRAPDRPARAARAAPRARNRRARAGRSARARRRRVRAAPRAPPDRPLRRW